MSIKPILPHTPAPSDMHLRAVLLPEPIGFKHGIIAYDPAHFGMKIPSEPSHPQFRFSPYYEQNKIAS